LQQERFNFANKTKRRRVYRSMLRSSWSNKSGETKEEAVRNAKEALALVLKVLREEATKAKLVEIFKAMFYSDSEICI
jgi:predicted RNase H-like HicB family nuclease